MHHMGLGETIGYSTRVSMNNDGVLYQNHSNVMNRAIYVALMGDPTLRQDTIAPPANLAASASAGSVSLSWSAPTDPVLGYHIYRATSAPGPFTRVTANLVAGTSYNDPGLAAGIYSYMVRAVALQTNPSGTYYNPSQGAFVNVTVSSTPSPMLTAVRSNGNLILTWNSQSGMSYHVQFKDALLQNNWSNFGSGITATGSLCTSSDTNIASRQQRFYRVISP
jgi:hypothetical protein